MQSEISKLKHLQLEATQFLINFSEFNTPESKLPYMLINKMRIDQSKVW